MTWFDVDGARLYLAGRSPQHDGRLDPEFKPTRKMVYTLVEDGLQVARLGASGRRLMFCEEWIDAFLIAAREKPVYALLRSTA